MTIRMENIEFEEFTKFISSTLKKANIETSYKYMQRSCSQQQQKN